MNIYTGTSSYYCILVLLLGLSSQVGSSLLTCFQCMSDRSLEDCESKQHKSDGCNFDKNYGARCYISQIIDQTGRKQFGKQCLAAKMCNKKSMCPKNATLCEVYCCDTPLCNLKLPKATNASVYPRTSESLMLFLLIMSFIMYIS